MSALVTPRWTAADYERSAREYQESLPLEHYMEGKAQARQRAITLSCFLILVRRIPEFHLFNELLVQFFSGGHLHRVVPDNMVVLGPVRDGTPGEFAVELEPSSPFWMLEYVSRSNKRKVYEENVRIYRDELRVPYYLIFDPETQDLKLLHRVGTDYLEVQPNSAGRLAVPELEVELALLDGWVRYWHRGQLLPLPQEMDQEHQQAIQRILDLTEELRQERAALQEKEAALLEKEATIQEKDAALQKKEVLIQEKDAALLAKETALLEKEATIQQKDQALAAQGEALRQKEQAQEQMVASMRSLVLEKALAANRQDIVAQLSRDVSWDTLQGLLKQL